MSETMNVYQKVARLRDLVDAIPKDAHNDHFKFDYTSSNAVLAAVKGIMSSLELMVIPSVERTNVIQSERSFLTEIWLVYTWVNTANPTDRFEQKWYAQGKDANELGPGKAYTYAEKYLFLKLLNVATNNDDPDGVAKPSPVKKTTTDTKTENSGPAAKADGEITEHTITTIRTRRENYAAIHGKDKADDFDKSLKRTASPMFNNFIGLSWQKATEEQGQWAIEQYIAQGA